MIYIYIKYIYIYICMYKKKIKIYLLFNQKEVIKMKHWRFIVEGTPPFPLDMLRYDRCFHLRGQDSVLLGLSYREYLEGNYNDGEPLKIELLMPVEAKSQEPTTGRWQSFGWKIIAKEFIVR